MPCLLYVALIFVKDEYKRLVICENDDILTLSRFAYTTSFAASYPYNWKMQLQQNKGFIKKSYVA